MDELEQSGTSTPSTGDWRSDMPKAARDLLGQQGERAAREHGWETGDFVSALYVALYRADATNRALIGQVFPAMALAVALWKDAPNGYQILHDFAGWKAPER